MNDKDKVLILIMLETFIWGSFFGHVVTIIWPAIKNVFKKRDK